MPLNLTIARKLAVAYGLFLAPIGYLGYQVMADREANIAFAQKELLGLHYISEVRQVLAALVRGAAVDSLVGAIKSNEAARGGALKTGGSTELLLKALGGTDRSAMALAAADLIGKAADGSNLTLDPDLDSFYTQDALTVKLPAIVAGTAGLVEAVLATSGRDAGISEQVSIGVLAGALQPSLDGLNGDIDNAVQGNPDHTVGAAVSAPAAKVVSVAKDVMAALADHTRSADAASNALPLLEAATAAEVADAAELTHLLSARIAGFRSTEMMSGGVAVTLFLMAVLYVLIVVQRGTIRPLRALTVTMRMLADHDLSVAIEGGRRRDEVGGIARAVQVFKDSMIRADALGATARGLQSARDRKQAAMDTHTQDFGASVAGVMASLGASASAMHEAASRMSAAATQTRTSTSDAVEGANESAQNLNTVAAAAVQMSSSINEISRQVAHVTSAVVLAVERATDTDQRMASLAAAAEKVGDVVRLISDIAARTNLLALNATIEAARAGEAGKGFAIVATEVKTLATQTARATGQIVEQITAIRSATQDALEAVRQVSAAIGQVDAVALAIAAAVEEQSAATNEITNSVQHVTASINVATHALGDVMRVAEETDFASRSVLVAADEVSRTADTLRVEVGDFLSAMKQGEGEDRRAYERIPGGNAPAWLSLPGQDEVAVTLRDISRGGVALCCASAAAAGTAATIRLSSGVRLSGRVVRCGEQLLTMAFLQNAANLSAADAAILTLTQKAFSKAA